MKKKIICFAAFIIAGVMAMSCVSYAYDLPQKYSSDDYQSTAVPVEVPEETEENETVVTYYNASELSLKVKPVYKKGILYVPVEEFFLKVGMNVSTKGGITISNENVTAKFKSGKNSGTVNGTAVKLSGKIKKIKGVTMCPADMIAEVLNAKVWFDEDSLTFAVSTGSYINDGILRIYNYKFWMNGEPYYEISFNKFDLFSQIGSYYQRNGEWPNEEDTLPAATEAIEQLSSLGFVTIRSFVRCTQRSAYFRSEKQKEIFYQIMDTAFKLCEDNGIKVVCCLELPSTDFCTTDEDYFDLICDENSESRKQLYQFINDFVTRYKDSSAVLMWEIVNEGNLETDIGWAVSSAKPSLYQLGQFYTDCANCIRQYDSQHLVTGGDSCFRASQWHQYLGTKEGKVGVDWTRDTLEDRMKAYVMLYSGLDVVSMHCYATGLGTSEFAVSDEDQTMVKEDFNLYMKEVRQLGKVLYNGECAVNADEYDEEVYEKSLSYLQDIINAGVQISHWWTFRNNSKTHEAEGYGWDISSGELLDAIIAANKQIKETYVVNGIKTNDTNSAFAEGDIVVDGTIKEVEDSLIPTGCGASLTGSAICLVAVVLGAAIVITRKKEKI